MTPAERVARLVTIANTPAPTTRAGARDLNNTVDTLLFCEACGSGGIEDARMVVDTCDACASFVTAWAAWASVLDPWNARGPYTGGA